MTSERIETREIAPGTLWWQRGRIGRHAGRRRGIETVIPFAEAGGSTSTRMTMAGRGEDDTAPTDVPFGVTFALTCGFAPRRPLRHTGGDTAAPHRPSRAASPRHRKASQRTKRVRCPSQRRSTRRLRCALPFGAACGAERSEPSQRVDRRCCTSVRRFHPSPVSSQGDESERSERSSGSKAEPWRGLGRSPKVLIRTQADSTSPVDVSTSTTTRCSMSQRVWLRRCASKSRMRRF